MNETSQHCGDDADSHQPAQRTLELNGAGATRVPTPAAAASMLRADVSAQPSDLRGEARHSGKGVSPSSEPFDRRYLDALVQEGIDLYAFLDGWCTAMRNDLDRLGNLRREGDFDDLPPLLHRLSGALGLVGAHSLMDALRRAPTTRSEHTCKLIDALAARMRTLIEQLEGVHDEHRSARP
jgi:HPt (histidine-containing phosphotransfer) domain-containing protein